MCCPTKILQIAKRSKIQLTVLYLLNDGTMLLVDLLALPEFSKNIPNEHFVHK